jgi:AcrR family transcriptional regulator
MMQEKKSTPQSRRPTARQKRLRADLVTAAGVLLEAGEAVTVTAAADLADVSRATAYRYFATNERLLAEAVLDQVAARMVALQLPTDAATPEAAAEALVDRVLDFVFANRDTFRLMLKLSLEPGAAGRGGRRLGWARQVLEPHADALRPGALEDLVPALALLLGPETMIVLQDVAGQSDDRARELARRTARALVASYRA